ncbi:hypothetical protein Kpho02_69880 [Kitasatospora phosalacinea]|uniref:Uncharacterized protein n=1 Tax=Kitasatospora phosalacinea TaxID=2065 RepID=A0A9W6QGS9_9ACTN|nr:hypothetical protein Kpho02_69880 [Kitasatospora phosalacinea]
MLAFIAAAFSALYTRGQLSLARRVRRESLEPYVVAELAPRAPESEMLCLVITNIGPTVARDVRVQVEPRLRTTLGYEQQRAVEAFLHRPIAMLPPGRRIMFNLGTAHSIFDEAAGIPLQYDFQVEAKSLFGDVEPLLYRIDLNALRESAIETETTVGQLMKIKKYMETIANTLPQLAPQSPTQATRRASWRSCRIRGRRRRNR